MGITGLIPLLEKSSRSVNISDFSGCTVAIDAYCWLHKGVYTCAEKLARGEDCQAYVHYCMQFVTMLLAKNIKPILVFDGQHLPAKADTESKRQKLREQNRKKAAELMRLDKGKEASSLLRRSIDVTHKMALNLIKQCRKINVDCIVAPYEADSQLAYLNVCGIAHVVITEDSDLLLFGCKRVLFKMDKNGAGLLIEQDKLYLSMNIQPQQFSLDRFRYMCILSGCDYLPSISGVGLMKARQFITRISDPDIYKSLSRLGSFMNVKVPSEYRDQFINADRMFQYQPVYDPLSRQIIPLNDIPDNNLPVLDIKLTSNQAYQLALGNIDPISLNVMDDWNPDTQINMSPVTKNKVIRAHHKSIWSKDYLPSKHEPKEYTLTPGMVNSTPPKSLKVTKNVTRSISPVNELPIIKKPLPVTEDNILTTLEEIYENEKLSDYETVHKEKHEIKKSISTKNNKIIEKVLIPEIDNVIVAHQRPTVFKQFDKKMSTIINSQKHVVSGYFTTQVTNDSDFFDKECINPFKCRKITVPKNKKTNYDLNTSFNSNNCINDKNKSQCFENYEIVEINTKTSDKISNTIQNSLSLNSYTNKEECNEEKYETIISSDSHNDEISTNIDTKKIVDENDIDEGFCSQNSKSIESSNNSNITPKPRKRSYPRTGLSKNTGKKNQTLLSKFGFKIKEQFKH